MKKLNRKMLFASLVAVGMLIMTNSSYAYTVVYNPGTTQYIDSLNATAYTDDIVGMELTAYFTGGTSETIFWESNSPSDGAFGTGWSITADGDTFGIWTLNNDSASNIDHILMDGFPGNTIFDVYNTSFGNTPACGLGWEFQISNTTLPDLDVTATYIDQVAILGADPVGDEYRYLDIAFGSDGFGAVNEMAFAIDTDIAFPSDATIPEPGTMLLLGSGLLSLVGYRKNS